MKIALAADHGGFELKQRIAQLLKDTQQQVTDLGCHSAESVDYPDFAAKAVALVEQGNCERAILICGTGIGMSIAANRSKKVRAALCHNLFTAQMSREHNDANILCLGARVLAQDEAIEMVSVWLKTEFAGGRHQRRIAKLGE